MEGIWQGLVNWSSSQTHVLWSYEASGQICGLISSFISNTWLQMFLGIKSLKGYPINTGVQQGSTLGPTLFLLHIARCYFRIFFCVVVDFIIFPKRVIVLQVYHVTLSFFSKHGKPYFTQFWMIRDNVKAAWAYWNKSGQHFFNLLLILLQS